MRKVDVNKDYIKARISQNGPCWEWTRCVDKCGYGIVAIKRRTFLAHRVSYQIFNGPIPEGMTIDHLCRKRKCVNPDHLEPVTLKENILRGNGPCAINARKTHCNKGHEFTENNIVWGKSGNSITRNCKTCFDHKKREASD
jgi:hypothetical protein